MKASGRCATALVSLLTLTSLWAASAQTFEVERRPAPPGGGAAGPPPPGGGDRDQPPPDGGRGDRTPPPGGRRPGGGAPPPGGGQPGGPQGGVPLPGLDDAQRALFNAGRREFGERKTIPGGLGPVFNGRSCVECHRAGGPGGAGPDLERSRVVLIGRVANRVFDPLSALGGSTLQRRSIREIDPAFPLGGERVPPEANVVSLRTTTPVFGAGLIEAIPERTILARVDPTDRNRDGISGAANRIFNPETGQESWAGSGGRRRCPRCTSSPGRRCSSRWGSPTPPSRTSCCRRGVRSPPAGTVRLIRRTQGTVWSF